MAEPDQGQSPAAQRILIVDDDSPLREALGGIARDAGHTVETLGEGSGVLDAVARFSPEIIVMDLSIPDCDGVEVLRSLAASGCRTPIILVSSHPHAFLEEVQRLGQAIGLTVRGVLQKPFAMADFLDAIGG